MSLSSRLPHRYIATLLVAMAYLAFTLTALPAMALPHPALSRGGTVGSYEAAERGEYLIGGTVVSVTDPLGFSTQITRNGLDQITQITDALGGISRTSYKVNSPYTL